MTETGFNQEAVYSSEKRFDQTVDAQNVNFFQGESQNLTDWKSLFKHPPSNLKFRRNSGSNRDSKRAIKIPCTSNTTSYTEPKPADFTKIPPPRAASTSPTKVFARKKEGYPELPVQTLKLHDHLGSAGNSSMSSSPTSQTSNCSNGAEVDDVYEEEEGRNGTAGCFGELIIM